MSFYTKKQLAFFKRAGSKGGRNWWAALSEEQRVEHIAMITKKSKEAREKKKALQAKKDQI